MRLLTLAPALIHLSHRYDEIDNKRHIEMDVARSAGLSCPGDHGKKKVRWELKQICWRRFQLETVEALLTDLRHEADHRCRPLDAEAALAAGLPQLRDAVVSLASAFVEPVTLEPYASAAFLDVVFDVVQTAATAVEGGSPRLSAVLARLVTTWATETSKELSAGPNSPLLTVYSRGISFVAYATRSHHASKWDPATCLEIQEVVDLARVARMSCGPLDPAASQRSLFRGLLRRSSGPAERAITGSNAGGPEFPPDGQGVPVFVVETDYQEPGPNDMGACAGTMLRLAFSENGRPHETCEIPWDDTAPMEM